MVQQQNNGYLSVCLVCGTSLTIGLRSASTPLCLLGCLEIAWHAITARFIWLGLAIWPSAMLCHVLLQTLPSASVLLPV